MAVHAAMVDRVDQGVGDIVAALKAAGRFENTLLLVLADNGASPERYRNPGFDRASETRDGRPIRYVDAAPGPETSWDYIGTSWASAANTPYRYWKKESYDGGCRTPLIAHWPAGLKTAPGATTDQLGHVIDVTPTCLDLAGAAPPAKPPEGQTLAPILRGERRPGHDALFFEHEGGRALLAGDWKLTALPRGPWQLYHVSADATETRDLAPSDPTRAADLAAAWTRWATRVGADIP
jgi:arylsulfatase